MAPHITDEWNFNQGVILKDDRRDDPQDELDRTRHQLATSERRLNDLGQHCQVLLTQLRGGHRQSNPRTDENHPGYVLIRLGWTFVGEDPDEPERPIWDQLEEDGCYWRDPEERGTGKTSIMPLTMALGIACRRLLGLREEGLVSKSRSERLMADE